VIGKKWLVILILFAQFSSAVFSDEHENRFSIQTSPLLLGLDIIYPSLDSGEKTETDVFLIDIEFQYAINGYFNISVINTFYFEQYLSSWVEDIDSGSRYNKNYGQQFKYMIMPSFLYRPLGTWLEGIYISAFPVVGWTHVSTNDTFTHLGFGLMGGYQWIFRKGFTMHLGTGLSKTWIIPFENLKTVFSIFNWPLDLHLTFRLGYSF